MKLYEILPAIILALLGLIVAIAGTYLLISFYHLGVNPADWPANAREGFCIAVMLEVGVACTAVAVHFINRNVRY